MIPTAIIILMLSVTVYTSGVYFVYYCLCVSVYHYWYG